MFQNFDLDRSDGGIKGYIWPCENPQRAMCIIHGVGEHAGRYDRMATYLNDAGIAVISMDLRGHGKSQGARGECTPRKKVLEDVTYMLEEAKIRYPGVPVVLYGHSLGGNICLDYRLNGNRNDLPVKYIVSAPWVRLVKNVPASAYAVMKAAAKIFPKATISTGCRPEDLGNLEITANYATDPLVHTKITLQSALEAFDIGEELYRGTRYDNRGAEGKPFLLMHGTDDKICSIEGARAVARQMEGKPSFTYIEWEGYYHEIHNGGPKAMGDEVIETIKDFILE